MRVDVSVQRRIARPLASKGFHGVLMFLFFKTNDRRAIDVNLRRPGSFHLHTLNPFGGMVECLRNYEQVYRITESRGWGYLR